MIDAHPLPELYLLIGVGNHLVTLCINVYDKFLDLLKRHNIFRHGYQGGGLDVRDCSISKIYGKGAKYNTAV